MTALLRPLICGQSQLHNGISMELKANKYLRWFQNLDKDYKKILLDKFLIALLLGFASFLFSKTLEHYKNVDAFYLQGSHDLVNANKEIWAQVYAYESATNHLTSLKKDLWFKESILKDINLDEIKSKIYKQEKLLEKQQSIVTSILNQNQHIIGVNQDIKFWQYMGLVHNRAEAELKAYQGDQDASDFVASLDKLIESMRFSSMDVRRYAIEKADN